MGRGEERKDELYSGSVFEMRLRIEQAAEYLETTQQGVRMLIQNGRIPGACVIDDTKRKRTYYITSEQIERFKRGEV